MMKRASAVSVNLSEKRSSSFAATNKLAPSFVPMSLRVSLNRVCRRYAESGFPLSSLGKELSTDLYMAGFIQDERAKWLLSFGFNSMEDMTEAFVEHGLMKVISRNGQLWIAPISAQKESKVDLTPPEQEENLENDYYEDSVSLVSDKMKSNFKAILKKHPDGLWCSLLPKAYKESTGYNLEVNELGFVSIIQMAMSLKDVFICTRPNHNSDWLLFDVTSNSVWNSPAVPLNKEVKKPTLPARVIYNIQALLEDFPSGIMKHKFLLAYKEKYNEDLPMADYGFDNLMAIIAHLASRNVIHLRFSGNLPMICSPLHNPEQDTLRELRKESDFISTLYPRGVFLPNDDIPVQPLPENFEVGCSIDILVTEVITPSFFWYQLWEREIQANFNAMMDELQKVYDCGELGKHKMPDATIQIGQYCAARYPPDPNGDGEWHRVIITSLPSFSEVELFYVDYGSKVKAPRSVIRFLEKKYGSLPLQAHKASLVGVRPPGFELWLKSDTYASTKPEWSPEACNCLLKIVGNQPLVGMVAGFVEDKVKFALIDTSKEEDLHINDFLVSARLAEFGEISESKEDALKRCSQASYDSRERSLDDREAAAKSRGHGPPSYERNTATNVNGQMNSQFEEWSQNMASTSPLPLQTSYEKVSFGEDSKFTSEREAMLPMSARSSPMSLASLHEKSRFGSDVPELNLVRMTSSPRSVSSSPMSPFLSAEKSMFESDAEIPRLVSNPVSPCGTNSPKSLGLVERNLTGTETNVTASGQALEIPMMQQNAVQGNLQALNQGNLGLNSVDVNSLNICLEIEKMHFQQQQLKVQSQFISLISEMIAKENSVPSLLQTGKVVPPPPGLAPLNPQWNYPLASNVPLNTKLPPGFETLYPFNVPQNYANICIPQYPASSAVNQATVLNSVGSSIPQSIASQSPGFESKAVNSVASGPASLVSTPALHMSSLNYQSPDKLPQLEKQQDGEPNNTRKIQDNNLKKDGYEMKIDGGCNSLNKVDVTDSSENLPVGISEEGNDVRNPTNSEQKSIGACSMSCDSVSLSSQQKSDDDKWKVKFNEDDKDNEGILFKGTVNGKPVSVLRIRDIYYVFTEEILGLFHSDLPVHVAMKIAKLKSDAEKIETYIVNPRRNKLMFNRIKSLVGSELIADGTDIHLTSVESLPYLCSSLELSSM